MTPGPQSHAARATDLVALVTFDNEVRENQAVTLESRGADGHRSRPLTVSPAHRLRQPVNLESKVPGDVPVPSGGGA